MIEEQTSASGSSSAYRMNDEEVRKIVNETIEGLKRKGMLKIPYNIILKEIEPEIKEFFLKGQTEYIEGFFVEHADDKYIDILNLHYRDGLSMEHIAEKINKDVSTVIRNKKRLLVALYEKRSKET